MRIIISHQPLFLLISIYLSIATRHKSKKITVLPVEYSHAYNLDLTSYEFYARLLEIHGVCDDTSGMPKWRNYTENKAQKV